MIRWLYTVFVLGTLVLTGCNRHDAEALSRIGKKVAAHARNGADEVGAKVDLSWAGTRREPSLHDKVQDRLRFENTLTDIAFEVIVTEKVVELKGTVTSPVQRQRAIELAETVAGVERVTDSILVREPDGPAK